MHTDKGLEATSVTDQNLIIRYVNPAFERLTGYTAGQVTGQSLRLFECAQHPRDFYRQIWNAVSRGAVWAGRVTIPKRDRTVLEAEVTLSPVPDATGHAFVFLVTVRDVAHEARVEAQMCQSQKLEALANLAGGIAHDFNNLLSAIVGYTDLALRQLPEDAGVRNDLAEVLRASGRAQDLVRQILTFSRQGERKREPVRVELVLEEALRLLRATLPTTIEIRKTVQPGCGIVTGDSTRIHQVIMNLCTNAYHAMCEHGGTLEVTLEPLDLAQHTPSTFPPLAPGSYLRLGVRDTGCGMDRATQERIFEPYFTTKPTSEATGLGLSTVLGIVKSLGGAITVYSEPEQGTVFHVYLPAAPLEAPTETVAPEPVPQGHGERILLVDDEEALVNLGKRMLEYLGYEVTARNSPVDALEAFRYQPEKFHLVLADQTMPHLTGLELAKELRQIRRDIPIILMTGFSELLTPERLNEVRIAAVLMKPIIPHELAEALQRALEER